MKDIDLIVFIIFPISYMEIFCKTYRIHHSGQKEKETMTIYRPNVGETLNMARIVITTSMIRLHFSNFGLHFWMMMVPIKHGIIAEQAQSMNQNGWNIAFSVSIIPFCRGAINNSIVSIDTGRDINIKWRKRLGPLSVL